MTELVEWLLARIAEDEAAAQICAKLYSAPWEMSDRGWVAYVKADAPDFREVARLEQEHALRGELAWLGDALEHVARWDPARVLAEVEAKRQIIAWHTGSEGQQCDHDGYTAPCPTLRALAQPYAACEGYREEWRP